MSPTPTPNKLRFGNTYPALIGVMISVVVLTLAFTVMMLRFIR